MDQEQVDLIVNAIAQGFAGVEEEIAGMGDAAETTGVQAEGAAAGFDVMGTATAALGTATIALTGATIAVGAAMGATKAIYDNTLGSAANLGEQVHQLGLEFGISSEDASKLIYVADLTGVSVQSLTAALDAAVRGMRTNKTEGIEPNIQGLETLADRWNAIPDPIQRAAFEMQVFGRSGQDIDAIMALGSAGIKALGDQATLTGNVLGDQATAQLHTYDVAVNQLTVDAKGLGVALGVDVAPAATRVVDGGLNLTHTLDLVNAAQQDGIITAFGQAAILTELATGVRSLKSVYDDLAPQVEQVNNDMANGSDASDRLAQANAYLADQSSNAADMIDQVAIHSQRFIDQANLDADAAAKDAAARAALNEVFRGGTVVAISDAASTEKLLTTNAKLLTSNGELIPQAKNYNELIMDSAVSHDQLTAAQEKLSVAQQKLSENTDPKKWSDLGAAVDADQLALMKANDAYNASVGATDAASAHVANYTTAIGKNTQAIKDNLNADFGQSIVNQLSKVDVGSAAYNRLLGELQLVNPEMAKNFTLASSQTAAQNLLNDAVAKGIIPASDAAKFFGIFAAQVAAGHDPMVALAQVSGEIATDAMPKTAAALDGVTQAATPATAALWALKGSEDALYDKQITITTTLQTLYGAGGPGYEPPHAAQGGAFTIPPGFHENFPVGPYVASSGEKVTITPAGQRGPSSAQPSGGDTVIINDRAAGALYLENRRRRSLSGLEARL